MANPVQELNKLVADIREAEKDIKRLEGAKSGLELKKTQAVADLERQIRDIQIKIDSKNEELQRLEEDKKNKEKTVEEQRRILEASKK